MDNTRQLTCLETFRRLNDYVDKELTPEEMELVQEHLVHCLHCSQEFQFEQNVLDCIREKIRRMAIPARLFDKMMASLPTD